MIRRLVLVAALATACHHESNLPKLFPVPNAKLVTDSGQPLQLDSMKGHVTVYDFIFTNCAGTCPLMTNGMRRLTETIDKQAPVRFVSISVDPARDTPAVLREYAKRVRADNRWIFLTGDRDAIVRLSVDGFKLAAGGPTSSVVEPLLHSSKFAVADKRGVIRDYYGATNDDAIDHVTGVVNDLLREN
jgi:cytochrome oxidase Cu insertion factor (SCO1/SenC/PrrC family)